MIALKKIFFISLREDGEKMMIVYRMMRGAREIIPLVSSRR